MRAFSCTGWREILLEKDPDGNERINRINYEISVLQALRERLRCKEIWVVGANRYRNPDEDLPTDFELQRTAYYKALTLPLDIETFVEGLQQRMSEALEQLDRELPNNPQVQKYPDDSEGFGECFLVGQAHIGREKSAHALNLQSCYTLWNISVGYE
jgi:hypothetical protein